MKKLDWKHIITELVLIVVGILLAVNLDAWYSGSKVREEANFSIKYIKEELDLNIAEMEAIVEANAPLDAFYQDLRSLPHETFDLVHCSVEEMNALRRKHEGQFEIVDSSGIEGNQFRRVGIISI